MKYLLNYIPFLINEAKESQSATQSQVENKPLVNQKKVTKPAIIIDGTSSAGKSSMVKGLVEKGWVIICGDDFWNNVDLRVQYDHGGNGKDLESGEEFHKLMAKEREGHFAERGGTLAAYKNHPKNKEYKSLKSENEITWYIYQDYLYGRGADPKIKGVVFDVIDDDILKCFKKDGIKPPHYVLLYAPLEELKRNVIARSKKDARGSWVFSDQFIRKFTAKESQEGSVDPDKSYTKKDIKELLDDDKLQKAFSDGELDIEKFIKDLGVKKEDKKYYIHKRNTKDKREVFVTRDKDSDDLEEYLQKWTNNKK
jgi:hypothetical protein